MNSRERKLRDALAASHAMACRIDEPGFPLAELESLQDWQRVRLAHTYSDLLKEDQFRDAGHFFLEELYGGLEFRERDREVEHVLPVMIRMLPGHLLESMADAFDLQALSLAFDISMAEEMARRNLRELDTRLYGELYRHSGRIEDRERQVGLIRQLGEELIELVQHRMVLRLVRFMRLPARAAGFGRLQGFLEEGLFAFRKMRDGHAFVRAIHDRETDIMRRLGAGDPDPFTREGKAA
jgi:uncharacterized protein (DUF924 family)